MLRSSFEFPLGLFALAAYVLFCYCQLNRLMETETFQYRATAWLIYFFFSSSSSRESIMEGKK